MKIAFSLFEYSPYSGLSLDFLRILEECKKRGHDTHVFVSEWYGERPEGVTNVYGSRASGDFP